MQISCLEGHTNISRIILHCTFLSRHWLYLNSGFIIFFPLSFCSFLRDRNIRNFLWYFLLYKAISLKTPASYFILFEICQWKWGFFRLRDCWDLSILKHFSTFRKISCHSSVMLTKTRLYTSIHIFSRYFHI